MITEHDQMKYSEKEEKKAQNAKRMEEVMKTN